MTSSTFILIPGRSTQQGTSLNNKSSAEYREATHTLRMNPEDMKRLGVGEGMRVRVSNGRAEIQLTCVSGKEELPPGVLFLAYGPESSKLMGGETHGTGMPDSKGLEVRVTTDGVSGNGGS